MSKIVALPPKVDDSCVQVLEEAWKLSSVARLCALVSSCAVQQKWSTAFSESDDSAQDAGMLLELAVRRLGFAFRKEGSHMSEEIKPVAVIKHEFRGRTDSSS